MTGKSKCKILKDIRRQIAADNDIEFVTADCKYQGECTGTCPKCEAEVRYLEQELAKRQQAGKAIVIAGLAATILVSATGCLPSQTAGDPLPPPSTSQQKAVDGEMLPPTTMGEEAPPATTIPWPTLMGVPAYDDDYDDDYEDELMGEPTETQPTDTHPTTWPPLMGDPVWPSEE